jgi:hypothetical protein
MRILQLIKLKLEYEKYEVSIVNGFSDKENEFKKSKLFAFWPKASRLRY